MRIGPLGTREVVALGLLIIAIVAGVSVTLLRPDDAAETRAAEERIAERTAAADPDRTRPTRTPVAVPTPLPAIEIDAPVGWQVRYETVASSGGFTPEGQFSTEGLDFSFPGPPFPDMRDNAWRLVAASTLEAERPGPWLFSLEYQGAVKVFVGEQLVGEGESAERATLEVEAPSRHASTSIRIEAQDTGGQFILRWK